MDLSISLPPDLIDVIAALVKEKLAADIVGSPWLTRSQAADYLGVPVSRLEKDRTVPAHRWDGRVLYHRQELDDFLRSQ
jgi:hypothetical protein